MYGVVCAQSVDDLAVAWSALDSAGVEMSAGEREPIELVAVGNPHLSLKECQSLAALVSQADADKVSERAAA